MLAGVILFKVHATLMPEAEGLPQEVSSMQCHDESELCTHAGAFDDSKHTWSHLLNGLA
jgi:hypothetical protein